MTYEAFKTELMEGVTAEINERGLKDLSLRFDTINSPDGMTDRLLVRIADHKMELAFRLREIQDDIENGEEISTASRKIVNTIEENISVVTTKEHDISEYIKDYSRVKDHIYYRLIPSSSPIIKDCVYKKLDGIDDFVIVANIMVEALCDSRGRSCVVVTKPILDMYEGVEEAQLFADCERNALKEDIVITPLEDMIRSIAETDEIPSSEKAGVETYIATNDSGFLGSSVIVHPRFTERVAEALGGKSLYLIPSSVHEFLLVADADDAPKAHDLNKMIKDINESVIQPRDFLANQCFHWDATAKKLEPGLAYEARKQALMKEAS